MSLFEELLEGIDNERGAKTFGELNPKLQKRFDTLRPNITSEEEVGEEEDEDRGLETAESAEGEELVEEPAESPELSSEELAYLTQRTEILRETEDENKEIVTDEIFSVEPNEEE